MKILFLHGLGQNRTAWGKTIKLLNCKDVNCIDVIPNNTENQSFSSLANQLEIKINEESSPLIICGLSLGAVLGLELYFRQPKKIAALILVAPQYKMPKLLIDIQNIVFKLMPNKIFSKMGISKNNMISISSSMRSLDYTNKIKNIVCPVYIVCGKNDKANIKAAENLNRLLLNSHLEFVDNSKHEVNIDNPAELARIINRIYEENK